jgi:hypothetical protein
LIDNYYYKRQKNSTIKKTSKTEKQQWMETLETQSGGYWHGNRFIKSKDVANDKLSNVEEKYLKSAHLIFINNVISGYFNSDVCHFD